MARASTAPMMRPPVPKMAPMPMNRAPRKARSTNVLSVFVNALGISHHLSFLQRRDWVRRSRESYGLRERARARLLPDDEEDEPGRHDQRRPEAGPAQPLVEEQPPRARPED